MSESSEVRYEVREDMRGEFTALVADQDLGPVKYAATFPVSRAMLDDSAFLEGFMQHGFDRAFRPWLFADRQGWPEEFVLFPRLERWHTTATDLRDEVRSRVRTAWRALRYGTSSDGDWY